MYVYIYIYIHLYEYMYIYTYCINMEIYKFIYMYVSYIYAYIHIYKNTYFAIYACEHKQLSYEEYRKIGSGGGKLTFFLSDLFLALVHRCLGDVNPPEDMPHRLNLFFLVNGPDAAQFLHKWPRHTHE